jgi:hypothetical protein
MQINNPGKIQERFMKKIVLPYIGTHARSAQKLHQGDFTLDREKALLTDASADRALWLVA